MNGTDESAATGNPDRPAPPADAERSYRLCPHCGGTLFKYGKSDPPGHRGVLADARDDEPTVPEFCCTYQRDAAKERERERKANAQRDVRENGGR